MHIQNNWQVYDQCIGSFVRSGNIGNVNSDRQSSGTQRRIEPFSSTHGWYAESWSNYVGESARPESDTEGHPKESFGRCLCLGHEQHRHEVDRAEVRGWQVHPVRRYGCNLHHHVPGGQIPDVNVTNYIGTKHSGKWHFKFYEMELWASYVKKKLEEFIPGTLRFLWLKRTHYNKNDKVTFLQQPKQVLWNNVIFKTKSSLPANANKTSSDKKYAPSAILKLYH